MSPHQRTLTIGLELDGHREHWIHGTFTNTEQIDALTVEHNHGQLDLTLPYTPEPDQNIITQFELFTYQDKNNLNEEETELWDTMAANSNQKTLTQTTENNIYIIDIFWYEV